MKTKEQTIFIFSNKMFKYLPFFLLYVSNNWYGMAWQSLAYLLTIMKDNNQFVFCLSGNVEQKSKPKTGK